MAENEIRETEETLSEEEAQALKPDYASEIISIIKGNDSPKIMQSKLEDYHGNDIAEVMESLTLMERKKLYRVRHCGAIPK